MRQRRNMTLQRLYALWLIYQVSLLTLGPGPGLVWSGLMLGSIFCYIICLTYPAIRPRVKIKADRERITISWDRKQRDAPGPDRAAGLTALSGLQIDKEQPCTHRRAEPVVLSTGDRVGWVCPDCPLDLPPDFKPGTRGVRCGCGCSEERHERVPDIVAVVARRVGSPCVRVHQSREDDLSG